MLTAGMKGVVVGLGRSGLAAVRYLHRRGIRVKVSESRDRELLSRKELTTLEQCGVELETGGHGEDFFGDADLVVLSPGVPPGLSVLQRVRARNVPVLGELALAAGRIPVPVIAVTGSNGKTTVTSLIGELLRAAGNKVFVGGNIGTPVLEYLLDPADAEVVVLELSSFQLELAGEFRPDIALLLNFSPDHLDRHGSMEAYAAAKRRIFSRQTPADVAILGGDDPLVTAEPPATAGVVYRFGYQGDCQARVVEHAVYLQPDTASSAQVEVYDLSATRLASRVNCLNAAAAILAVATLGCSPGAIRKGLARYQPPAHRMTPVAELNGIYFVDDSKATNVGAVAAALAGFEKNVVLVAGGRDKGSDFTLLRDAVRNHLKYLVLIGEAATDLAGALGDIVAFEYAGSMEEAVRRAFAAADSGDTVLLAPACASFDMFADYGSRGEAFSRCVRDLGDGAF